MRCVAPGCPRAFVPRKSGRPQLYCSARCRRRAHDARHREALNARMRAYWAANRERLNAANRERRRSFDLP